MNVSLSSAAWSAAAPGAGPSRARAPPSAPITRPSAACGHGALPGRPTTVRARQCSGPPECVYWRPLDAAADAFDLGDDVLLGVDVDQLRVELDRHRLTRAVLDRDDDVAALLAAFFLASASFKPTNSAVLKASFAGLYSGAPPTVLPVGSRGHLTADRSVPLVAFYRPRPVPRSRCPQPRARRRRRAGVSTESSQRPEASNCRKDDNELLSRSRRTFVEWMRLSSE